MRMQVALMLIFVITGTSLWKFWPGNWILMSDLHTQQSWRFSSTARWVPKMLTNQHKMICVRLPQPSWHGIMMEEKSSWHASSSKTKPCYISMSPKAKGSLQSGNTLLTQSKRRSSRLNHPPVRSCSFFFGILLDKLWSIITKRVRLNNARYVGGGVEASNMEPSLRNFV